MSPRKFVIDGDHNHKQLKSGMVMNGPRPTPLKVNQESHTIHKQQQVKKPVIIYTYSPEVIHTKPHDFMALVQKLTGHSGSGSSNSKEEQVQKPLKKDRRKDNDSNYSNDDDSAGDQKDNRIIKDKSPMFNASSGSYNVADIPLFTPNSSDYFCSTRPLFRFSDMVSSSPNMSNLLSPSSLVELLKGLPEY